MKPSSATLSRALGQTELIKRLIKPYFPTALGLTFQLHAAQRPVTNAAALVTYIVDMPELLPSKDFLASPSKWGRTTSLVGDIKEETAIAV